MYRHSQKTFRNTATTPILISVIALVDDDGFVRDIFAGGGTLLFTDDARAEAQRMHAWVRRTFIGQSERFFGAHNGVVPDSPAQAESRMRSDAGELEGQLERLGKKCAASAPQPGTYWQDRKREGRFFVVTEVHPCAGHAHVWMLRVDYNNDGTYSFPYENDKPWSECFKQVRRNDVPGLYSSSYEALSVEYMGLPYVPGKGGHVGFTDEDRRFLVTDIDSASEHMNVEEFFRAFLDAVGLEGKELPPAVGERYYSLISTSTYRVVDVRPKAHKLQEPTGEYTVTMERETDQRRAKYTFRSHAAWLTVWRPLDDELSLIHI